jgi:homoserine O-acetyltransferase
LYKTFTYTHPFTLECGIALQQFHLGYSTHGQLNAKKDNVVWVFHALTANSDPAEWWPGLVGEEKLFNPAHHFIVCVNMPGSCYGSIGPLTENSETHNPWYHHFPFFTPRDMVRAYQKLSDFLGIESIHIGIGGSMGGQQLLEWAIDEPDRFEYLFPIATNAQHSPWAIAFNATQRLCIEADKTWLTENEHAGIEGMKVARAVALLSYRNYETYLAGQSEEDVNKITRFRSESYQRYQGEKLATRFNAFSYYVLSQSMDSHNVGRNRGSVKEALLQIRAKTLAIGIKTDILFPLEEQEFLASVIPGASFHSIHSPYGHDGFLLEYEAIEQHIRHFMNSTKNRHPIFAITS